MKSILCYHSLIKFIIIPVALCLLALRSFSQQSSDRAFKDSVRGIFDDSSYLLTLTTFDSTNNDENKTNTILQLIQTNNGIAHLVFSDSLYCWLPVISLQDFNNDNDPDITILYTSSARSNQAFHLYISENKSHKLIRIKDFEKLLNPSLNPKDNITISTARYGKTYFSFYRINKRNQLLNLGHSFETTDDDPFNQYEQAIRNITKRPIKSSYPKNK